MMIEKILQYVVFVVLLFSTNVSFAGISDFSLQGHHGTLKAVLQYPNKAKYPLVILMHGFNANKDMFLLRVLSDELEKKGIASVRFDFNGHGESDGNFEDMTILNELEDARKVYEYISTKPQVISVSLAGHSQGGLVASMLAGELGDKKIKTLVLMAASPNIRDMVVHGNLFGVKFDIGNIPEFIDIPGCCRVGKKYLETSRDLKPYKVAVKYTGPVALIHGKQDNIVPISYSKHYLHRYKNAVWLDFKGRDSARHNYQGYEKEVGESIASFINYVVYEMKP